jgi:hypothetical protein
MYINRSSLFSKKKKERKNTIVSANEIDGCCVSGLEAQVLNGLRRT